MSERTAIRLHSGDKVVVAVQRLHSGDEVGPAADRVTCRQVIPPGHKLATRFIAEGESVVKYGNPIGIATEAIEPGHHVHCHNLIDSNQAAATVGSRVNAMSQRMFAGETSSQQTESTDPSESTERFMGFRRSNGAVGTRNYVLIASRVNCSASVCHEIQRRFPADRLAEFPNVDGIAVATHTTGCAMQYGGIKQQMLGRVLSGYAANPNVAATLMIGLGCEQTTADYLFDQHELPLVQLTPAMATTANISDMGAAMLTMQAEGGTRATIDHGEKLLEQLLARANECVRVPVAASHLKVALECGGSDGYSGVSANPVVGVVADHVVDRGGAAVLSETTEIYGAEHLLYARSVNVDVASKLQDKIQWWQDHVSHYGGRLDNNPSVGNKAGGLTTITEKSLGAVAKSGSRPLVAVIDYAEQVPPRGLCVMDTPGFDPASVTGKVAGGCNLVLFTTGRGSCFGCKPVPVVKIASNSVLFQSMRDDMDFDAGPVLGGEEIEVVGADLFQDVLAYASGEPTKSERQGLGDHEFVPWTVGPVL